MAKRQSLKQIYDRLEAANRSAAPGTYVISDIDGRNTRTVTLESFRAEIEAAKARIRASAVRS